MEDRIKKIYEIIDSSNLDAIALVPGSNFRYVTGGNFHLMERPTVLIITKNKEVVAILPSLEVDSFNKLGINAKGATKRLNKEELEKIKSYFETGKNVSDEVININKIKTKSSSKKIVEKVKIKYFANRLIRKS